MRETDRAREREKEGEIETQRETKNKIKPSCSVAFGETVPATANYDIHTLCFYPGITHKPTTTCAGDHEDLPLIEEVSYYVFG